MDITTVLLIIIIGLIAGILSGLIGIGGGIVIVPALIYILGLGPKAAQGTSLALLLLPVGILAVWQYYKQGQINFSFVAIMAIGFVFGGYLGSKLALSLPSEIVKKVFAVFMIVMACKMLLEKKKVVENKPAQIEKSEVE